MSKNNWLWFHMISFSHFWNIKLDTTCLIVSQENLAPKSQCLSADLFMTSEGQREVTSFRETCVNNCTLPKSVADFMPSAYAGTVTYTLMMWHFCMFLLDRDKKIITLRKSVVSWETIIVNMVSERYKCSFHKLLNGFWE